MNHARCASYSIVLLAMIFCFISNISAFDVGDPDISIKILAPEEFMPNSTYFIGIKYGVNQTFWGKDPAVDPKINFNIENAEIVNSLSGIFNSNEKSQEVIFSLAGEIDENRNETAVVIIKTSSHGNVNMHGIAEAHDSDNYKNVITFTFYFFFSFY